MGKDDFSFSLSESSTNEISALIEQYAEAIVGIINDLQDELIDHISLAYYDKLVTAVDGIIELYNDSVRAELKQSVFEEWQNTCESMTAYAKRMEMGEESEAAASGIEESLSILFDAPLENRLNGFVIDERSSASAYDFEQVKELFSEVVSKVQGLSDDFTSQLEELSEENDFYRLMLPVLTSYIAGISAYFEQSKSQIDELEENYLDKMEAKREAAVESKKEVDLSALLNLADLAYDGMGPKIRGRRDTSSNAGSGGEPKQEEPADTPAKAKPTRTSLPRASGSNRSGLSETEAKCIKENVAKHHCDKAREIVQIATKDGKPDDTGKNFTSHNEDHLEQVMQQTSEALGSMVDALNSGSFEREGTENNPLGDVHFNADVDFKVVQAAAIVHDTGMSDEGYTVKKDEDGNIIVLNQDPTDFNSVRGNHSANSALNVLL